MSTRSACVALLVVVFSIPQPVRADTVANPLFTQVPYGAIASQGELGRRLRLSFRRLEKYTPKLALAGNEGWPGDREGRAILGQVLTSQAMGTPSQQAEALVAGVKARLNAQGYLGAALPAGVMDEQVLAGHSWLLRGLIEYHKHKRDQDSLQMIRGLVNNLLLPARAAYERYPTSDRIDRKQKKQTAPLWVPSRMVGGYQATSVVRS